MGAILFKPALGFVIRIMKNCCSDTRNCFVRKGWATKLPGLLLLWLVAGWQSAVAYELNGKVVSVADGDTITVRDAGENYRIRLASIDAPEKGNGGNQPGQPYGEAARRFLADQVAGKTVTLTCFEEDRFGRHICDVLLDDVTANQLLVYAGMAWANRQGKDKYLRDRRLLALQDDARANKRGLWAEPEPVAPWVWRYQCWRQGQCGK
jgi:micrococcal nuclease